MITPVRQSRFRVHHRLKRWVATRWIDQKIRRKWRSDAAQLPLTVNHWLLYRVIHRASWQRLGRFPDLVNCRDLNDHVNWLKLFDQDEILIRCADKLAVRDFIRERLGPGYTTKVFQVCNHFDQIDFGSLPSRFVIKCNHDSGSVVLVTDKLAFDQSSARTKIEAALTESYGWYNGEWHYAHIKPKVMVEEFIDAEGGDAPLDYRFHCVDGRVRFVRCTGTRSGIKTEVLLDDQGRDLGYIVSEKNT